MLIYLAKAADWFGPLRVFESITVRAAVAVFVSFGIALFAGPRFIAFMRRRNATEDDEKPDAAKLGELHGGKKGTPTMGGVFLVLAVSLAVFLCCDPASPLVWVGQFVFLSFGVLGLLDDYWKLRGWGKKGLTKRHKFGAAVILAALTCLFLAQGSSSGWFRMSTVPASDREADIEAATRSTETIPATRLVIPFTKWSETHPEFGFFYWVFAALIIVACANSVNLTDGLDGLATGCTIMVAITYAALAYIVGNALTCAFFRIPMVPGAGELSIFGTSLFGGLMGFLWFNSHPARVFMGDTGSLALGAAVAFLAIATKHELTLILAGGMFVLEAMSVILQVASFRLLGRRIFKIAPFHHHLEYSGWKENHVVIRLWIISVLLSIMSLGLLKMH